MQKRNYSVALLIFILASCTAVAPEPTMTPAPTSTPMPSPTPEWERPGWNIVWQDEFEGTEINRENWTFDTGGGGWGNAEWEAYTERPENARLVNGMLVIEAREEEATFSGLPYSSARM
jgi:beta-glucanase (GH16 family)